MRPYIATETGTGTAGLATAYQVNSTTALGPLAVMDTAGQPMLMGITRSPYYTRLPMRQLCTEPAPDMAADWEKQLGDAYKALAAENSRLAEEILPAALEEWPDW